MFGEKGIGQFVKQAKNMEEHIKKVKNEVLKLEVVGQSGAGMVTITLNGNQEVSKVLIDEDTFKEEKVVLEELVAFAFNDALKQLNDQKKEKFSSMGQLLNIGDVKMPF